MGSVIISALARSRSFVENVNNLSTIPKIRNVTDHPVRFQSLNVDQRNLLGLSLMLVLAITFTINYLAFTYYPTGLLKPASPGFWLYITGCVLITGIALLTKISFNWSWAQLGLSKPKVWWKPIFISGVTFGLILLFSLFVQPYFRSLGNPPKLEFILHVKNNLPQLLFSLTMVWIFAAFLEEFIFRAFSINALGILLGNSRLAVWISVILSALVFGGIHAYQGISGILTTTCLGLIFGVAFLFNGRRIWPLIFVHGIIDTITLLQVYYMA